MWFTRSLVTARARLEKACRFEVESLERRVLLSSAIAAFHPPQNYPTGTDPLAVKVADVNRDGKPDLIVANFNDSISVLLGDGTGAFSSQQTYAAGRTPTDVAVADVNGDGTPDILVADYSGSIGVLLGNGDGTFQPVHTFVAGYTPVAIACADINGDGKLDVLVANETSRTVSLLLGNGDGTFQSPQTFLVGAAPSSLAIADVNHDGRPDVIVTDSGDASVSVLLGTGSGFEAQQTFAAGPRPRSVVVSDINFDGKPDLVLVNQADGTAAVLLGNGDGTFAAPMTFAAGAWANAVVVADVNGDGKEDLVAATAYPGNVSVLLGNGNGSFQPAVDFFIGNTPNDVAVADVNADGRADIITADQRIDSASVFVADVPPRVLSIDRANPSGVVTSDSSVTYTVTFNEPVTGVDPTDFTLALTGGVTATTPVVVSGSGAVYSVTVSGISGMGTLGLNLVDDGGIQDAAGNPLQPTGTAYFPSQATIAVGASPVWMTTADVNGDGKPDLIVANRDDNSVGMLLGNGNGTFQPQITTAANAPSFVAAADLNRDGKIDLVTVNPQSNSASVLLGNGNGTFQTSVTVAVGYGPSSVAVADVNGDGNADLIVTHGGYVNYGRVSVLPGNGDGTFMPQVTFIAPFVPNRVVVADVNGDGRPDLLVGSRGPERPILLLSNGNGTFQEQTLPEINFYPSSLAVADLNGDGKPDLMIGSNILLGNGNGTFQAAGFAGNGGSPSSLVVVDINGDGRPDLVITNYMGYGVDVLLGNGDGTFQSSITFAAGTNLDLTGVVVADFNGDGRPDIAVVDPVSNSVSVLLGPSDGSIAGQTYTISNLDTITGTADTDYITLVQDSDHEHIDWFLSSNTITAAGQMAINDPNGLTIDGLGTGPAGGDQIYLDYSNGTPLPSVVHLNEPQPGNMVINGLSGSNPLATTTLDIGRSIVYLDYAGTADPIGLVRAWLSKGYNGGAWTGTGDVITSSAAAANHSVGLNTTGVGWADSADGQKVNGNPLSIELMYTLYGDANLDGQVNSADLQRLLFGLNKAGSWDLGDFNYDGEANSADLQALLFNFNRSLGTQPTPMAIAATPAASALSNAKGRKDDFSAPRVPAIHATGSAAAPVQPTHSAKGAGRKKR